MEVNPEILEIFCKISQKIAIVKGIVAANCQLNSIIMAIALNGLGLVTEFMLEW